MRLRNEDLRQLQFANADLREAEIVLSILSYANLMSANCANASFAGCDLRSANLQYANLSGCGLSGVVFQSACLDDANLNLARLPFFSVCPEAGRFTAFKKVRDNFILTLEIPAGAGRVSSLVGRKCRATSALVVKAETSGGHELDDSYALVSQHDSAFRYHLGGIAMPHDFNDDIRVECAPGIHFFMTREEAVDY